MPALLEHRAQNLADAPFLQWTDSGSPLSFANVNESVNRIAHGLAARGVRKGDLVALFLPNSLEYVLIWFALNKLGAVEVTLGDSLKSSFLRHPLALSGARLLIMSSALTERIAEIEDALPDLSHAIIWNDPTESVAAPVFRRITTSRFEELPAARCDNPGIEVRPRDPAAVLFTSGTTGPAKAVAMPHAQLYFFAEELIQVVRLDKSDVYLTSFPLSHANAQLESVYPALIVGIRCVLYRRFSASDWLGRIRRSGASVTNCLGATMAFIASQPPAASDRDHALRCVFAAPAPPGLSQVFRSRFGIGQVVTGYGQTEISMPFLSPPDTTIPDDACGVLLDQWFEVALIDPVKQQSVDGPGSGELLVRHKVAGIMSDGFYGMPEKTLEAWRDLWFHTGDAMRRDANGWYYFVDRLKDTLRRRGENISSFEVEAVVRAHPSVLECAVIAAPSGEEGGEDEVMACIVLQHPATAFDPAELISFCEPRMPAFAVPRYVEVLAALPKTPSEKIQKAELRRRGVTSATWDRAAVAR